ncbi:MAG: hypothetical protein AAF902_02305 [Chloroflexota bacterium]
MNKTLIVIAVVIFTFLLAVTNAAGQEDAEPAPEPTSEVIAVEESAEEPNEEVVEPSPTPEPVIVGDFMEPNNNFETATTMYLGESQRLSLTVGDKDYIQLYLKAGQIVRLTAAPIDFGDTSLSVFQTDGTQLGFNDDLSATDRSASLVIQAPAEGYYIVLVESPVPLPGMIEYEFYSSLQMPTPTPTLTPTSTPAATSTPGPTSTPAPTSTPVPTATPLNTIDNGEPNNSPADAYQIVPGVEYQMTLGPAGFDDHDFYSFLGKAWKNYSCQTETTEIDTEIRMYVGEIGAGELVAQNDDAGNGISSRATYQPATDQWIFVVVESRAGVGGYTFSCDSYVPPPVAAAPVVAAEPEPVEQVVIIEEPAEEMPVEDPVMIADIAIAVFNDRNADGLMDLGEAVNDVLVVVTPLGGNWGVQSTTQNGLIILSEDTTSVSHLIVSVPYLYYSQVIEMRNVNGVINIPIDPPVLPVVLP